MSEHVLTDTFFENFDLHPLLQQGLADCGFTRCTPIQALSLPLALAGRDIAGQAQTGTGKTCAFLVAVMNRLLTQPATAERKDTDPRALVIAPTRELAIQIEKDALAIGRHTGLRCALIYGGVDYDKQRQQLKDGCDIIIATPGRLLDYYKQHVFGLDGVEAMVIDEADRMFDLGFIKDVRFIFRRLPAREERQVLLYSATLSYRVLELAYEHMHNPEKMVVESENITADHVRQVVYFPSKEEKMPLLLNLLEQKNPSRSIVFVNTKAAAERITDRLKRHNYRAGAISGDVPQVKRQKLLQRFKDSQLDILVATDVAARGLHIPAVSHVFNYDLPQDAEDYVHRIGRTARLGSEGDAISFACDLYAMSLPEIQDYIGQQIPVASVDPELLIMPKPRAPDAQFLAEAAADSAAYGDKIAPRPGQDSKGPRSRSRSGESHSGERRPRPAPVAPAAPVLAPPAAAAEAIAMPTANGHGNGNGNGNGNGRSAPAQAVGDASVDGAPRKRRRRGGRNRRRDGDAANGVAAAGSSPASGADHRPRQGKNGEQRREPRPITHVEATRQKPAPANPPKKPGLLRRLTSTLFGAR